MRKGQLCSRLNVTDTLALTEIWPAASVLSMSIEGPFTVCTTFWEANPNCEPHQP